MKFYSELRWKIMNVVGKAILYLLLPALLLSCVLFLSCSKKDPIKIGFVGGLTGRVAALGISARDGVIMATEDRNLVGGINGRHITLVVKDDKQDADVAARVDGELLADDVVAIIGHMTSSMSIVGVPIVNAAKRVMISPTTSADELSGIDDYFLRLYPATAVAARKFAEYIYKEKGYSRITVIYDLGNGAYTTPLFNNFKREFMGLGGGVVAGHSYVSAPGVSFVALANEVYAQPTQCLLILANALDTAMICQQFKKRAISLPIFASEWSASEELLEFGGGSVEGISILQNFNKDSSTPAYLRFVKAFHQRFNRPPDFAAVHAYDAATIIFTALAKGDNPELLRDNILSIKEFSNLQGSLSFDKYGDTGGRFFLMTVKNGHFVGEKQLD